ncbi:hypothetical protein HDU76_003460, partial [Blyttiomyces sp. JEL0837]
EIDQGGPPTSLPQSPSAPTSGYNTPPTAPSPSLPTTIVSSQYTYPIPQQQPQQPQQQYQQYQQTPGSSTISTPTVSTPTYERVPGIDPVFGAGALRGARRILEDGLTKKTISITMEDNKKYRVVSYYARSDVIGGVLVTPTESEVLSSIDQKSERLLSLLPVDPRVGAGGGSGGEYGGVGDDLDLDFGGMGGGGPGAGSGGGGGGKISSRRGQGGWGASGGAGGSTSASGKHRSRLMPLVTRVQTGLMSGNNYSDSPTSSMVMTPSPNFAAKSMQQGKRKRGNVSAGVNAFDVNSLASPSVKRSSVGAYATTPIVGSSFMGPSSGYGANVPGQSTPIMGGGSSTPVVGSAGEPGTPAVYRSVFASSSTPGIQQQLQPQHPQQYQYQQQQQQHQQQHHQQGIPSQHPLTPLPSAHPDYMISASYVPPSGPQYPHHQAPTSHPISAGVAGPMSASATFSGSAHSHLQPQGQGGQHPPSPASLPSTPVKGGQQSSSGHGHVPPGPGPAGQIQYPEHGVYRKPSNEGSSSSNLPSAGPTSATSGFPSAGGQYYSGSSYSHLPLPMQSYPHQQQQPPQQQHSFETSRSNVYPPLAPPIGYHQQPAPESIAHPHPHPQYHQQSPYPYPGYQQQQQQQQPASGQYHYPQPQPYHQNAQPQQQQQSPSISSIPLPYKYPSQPPPPQYQYQRPPPPPPPQSYHTQQPPSWQSGGAGAAGGNRYSPNESVNKSTTTHVSPGISSSPSVGYVEPPIVGSNTPSSVISTTTTTTTAATAPVPATTSGYYYSGSAHVKQQPQQPPQQ